MSEEEFRALRDIGMAQAVIMNDESANKLTIQEMEEVVGDVLIRIYDMEFKNWEHKVKVLLQTTRWLGSNKRKSVFGKIKGDRHFSIEDYEEFEELFSYEESYTDELDVLRLLENLTDTERFVVEMYALRGFTFEQVSQMMGSHRAGAARVYNRAINKLKAIVVVDKLLTK